METKSKRGDTYQTPGGGVGRYVGTTPAGVEWVAYRPQDFQSLCERFDARFPAQRRLRRVPVTVIEEAYWLAEYGAEAEVDYCTATTVTATTIAGPPLFFQDLAERLLDAARDFESGDRTTDEGGSNRAFVEGRDRRLAATLRKWASRCERTGRCV